MKPGLTGGWITVRKVENTCRRAMILEEAFKLWKWSGVSKRKKVWRGERKIETDSFAWGSFSQQVGFLIARNNRYPGERDLAVGGLKFEEELFDLEDGRDWGGSEIRGLGDCLQDAERVCEDDWIRNIRRKNLLQGNLNSEIFGGKDGGKRRNAKLEIVIQKEAENC